MAKVTVDEGHLRRLHDVTIRQTHNFNVEKLEKLHSRMSQCIYRHRSEPNKGNLIKVREISERHAVKWPGKLQGHRQMHNFRLFSFRIWKQRWRNFAAAIGKFRRNLNFGQIAKNYHCQTKRTQAINVSHRAMMSTGASIRYKAEQVRDTSTHNLLHCCKMIGKEIMHARVNDETLLGFKLK